MDSSLLLTVDMLLVLGMLGLTVVLLIGDWFPADVAGLLVLVMLGLSGLVPADQLFDGFSSNAVMSIIAVMVLGAGLDRAGVLKYAAGFIIRMAAGLERRLSLLLSMIAGSLSGFMQNPAVVSLFLPVAGRISSRTGQPIASLLMPMACCVILGGSMTTVGNSPMILLNDLLASSNRNLPEGADTLQSIPLFAVFPVGLTLLIAGLAYFYFYGYKRLPENDASDAVTPASVESYFERISGRRGELFELLVTANSIANHKTLAEVELLAGAPLILALKLPTEEPRIAPSSDRELVPGAIIGVLGEPELVLEFSEVYRFDVRLEKRTFRALLDPDLAGISEAVIPPHSPLIGRTLADLRLRRRFGISPLAVTRGEDTYNETARNLTLRSGDCLIFHSTWKDLAEQRDREFVVVTDFPKQEARPEKLFHAILFFLLPMMLALLIQVPLPVALLSGAVGMLISGVLTVDEAYKAISWRTVFSLAAMIPLGGAMESTGAAAWLAQEMVYYVNSWPDVGVQFLIAIMASLFTMVMSQIGATVVMVPMAINIALAANHNPIEYALIAALAASNNLITSSNPVIAMVSGPAGYSTRDFVRAGLPLMVIYLFVIIFAVNVLW